MASRVSGSSRSPPQWASWDELDHLPDPGRHRTLFDAYYANRVRGDRAAEEPGGGERTELVGRFLDGSKAKGIFDRAIA